MAGRRKGGRPRLAPEDLRRGRLIYLSDREFSSAELRGEAAGLSFPEFSRAALASATIIAAPTVSLDQWSQLAPLASNINQIAARLNSKSDEPISATDLDSLADLDRLLRDIRLRLLSVEPSL